MKPFQRNRHRSAPRRVRPGSRPPGVGRGGGGERGFTLIELMIVVAVIGLLISILLPGLAAAMEQAKRIRCRAQLKDIYQAMVLYSNSNQGRMPIAPGTEGRLNAAGTARNVRPDGAGPAPVSATLWLLLRDGGLTPALFVCPSSRHQADTASGLDGEIWDFASADRLSYAVQYPYSQRTYYGRSPASASEMPVLADRGPFLGDGGDLSAMTADSEQAVDDRLAGAANRAKVNSANHGGAGQNVVYADGHADWSDRPTAGARRDNIYTVQDGTTGVGRLVGLPPLDGGPKEPASDLDTVLVH